MTTTRIALTPKAYALLDRLDNRAGRRVGPRFGTCPVCEQRCTIWPNGIICPTRVAYGSRCPGNGHPGRGL